MKRLVLAYFSPTHTTQKLVRAIAEGMEIEEIVEKDMTIGSGDTFEAAEGDVLVVGGPVYQGRIPAVAVERLSKIKGKGQPVVCLAVYGNNRFGDAIIELAGMVEESGLVPVAGAGFVGEHSYSTDKWHIANGRPNEEDLALARKFGKQVIDKLKCSDDWKLGLKNLNLPGEMPTEPAPGMPYMQTVINDKCTGCKICVDACPVGAIDEELICDGDKCIKCCACIKACPENAREFNSPVIEKFSEKLSKVEDKIPEVFL